ncbi:MAG TPA: efflux RND transporter periplasmic adaptor subunit [Algoriphagus sp.]|jgi:Cu(I)/Ag(I) efflux system membrane fusion protein|uniref:efflux RND transporter periplasmic adaptor subunit n=1 Tax=unclassified Algoriphagus TaxID=2641541 RepID=UPI000C638890|nr:MULTISPECIES: efflux RND transporter periplasmic adaptor subunit [unclassified Algoriphagus]MAL14716.1 efflux transporter periplasmic adaptor subunit [Algoriphagus sp.]HCD87139.1 efflux RND transporter periplasmic adaptor subunit [Algoriphagus sp.]HCH44856.1 efflux RND transporter periplasmic adaptor subunit [Algoriphagus sp.]HCX76105.1 efflux RND transporter periplasmic adaptor subunit [Algoriphagus sp.]
MKKLLENKWIKIAGLILLGVALGWLVKPSGETSQEAGHDHLGTLTDQLWTCSMHPQIKLNEPGDCPICGMDLIPVASNSSSGNSNPIAFEMTPEAIAMANVSTTIVGGTDAKGDLFLTGKIQADERENAAITAKFPARIEKLYVTFTGEQVRVGQRLASIYSPELLTAQRELIEAVKTKASFPELYQAAKEKLKLWKLNEAQISEIEKSGQVKDKIDILAEFSGVVTQRNIAVGDYVSTGQVLFNVVDLSRLWVLMDAYESDLPFIKVGNEVNFNVAGIPGENFKAKVTYIDPMIDPNTRAASIRAEVLNRQSNLKPEMFVTARIQSTQKGSQAKLSIPRTAVLWSGKRSVVYLKVPNSEIPTYEMREITLGSRVGDNYQIESGLQAGEEIVTNGVFAIDAAAQLSGNFSMMNRPETRSLEVSSAFRDQITQIADAYFRVKNGLVSDQLNQSQKDLTEVKKAVSQVDMKLVEGKAHDSWMKVQAQLNAAVGNMDKASSIDEARKGFSTLSEAVLEMTELFGLNKEAVYKDYCPMAFGNQGAFWLSERKDITNPYFGASMLTCGEVKQTYLKGQAVLAKEQSKTTISTSHNH